MVHIFSFITNLQLYMREIHVYQSILFIDCNLSKSHIIQYTNLTLQEMLDEIWIVLKSISIWICLLPTLFYSLCRIVNFFLQGGGKTQNLRKRQFNKRVIIAMIVLYPAAFQICSQMTPLTMKRGVPDVSNIPYVTVRNSPMMTFMRSPFVLEPSSLYQFFMIVPELLPWIA